MHVVLFSLRLATQFRWLKTYAFLRASHPILAKVAWDRLLFGRAIDFLRGDDVTDSLLAKISAYSNIQYLELDHTAITDYGLKFISSLTQLKTLSLRGTKVTDAGLVKLHALRKLQKLNVEDTDITGVGFGQLGGLGDLRDLAQANRSWIDDSGLDRISSLSSLRSLGMQHTRISDAGGSNDSNSFQILLQLGIADTNVSDAGVEYITSLQNIELLDVGNDRVTDASLHCFQKMTKLEELWIDDTQISPMSGRWNPGGIARLVGSMSGRGRFFHEHNGEPCWWRIIRAAARIPVTGRPKSRRKIRSALFPTRLTTRLAAIARGTTYVCDMVGNRT